MRQCTYLGIPGLNCGFYGQESKSNLGQIISSLIIDTLKIIYLYNVSFFKKEPMLKVT